MVDVARRRLPSVQGVAGVGGDLLVLQEGEEPEELFAARATTNLHQVLGVEAALGRDFVPGDAAPGAEPVVILSHRLWVERFGADPGVLGRSIALGGEGHRRRTVVGIMPEGYLPLQGPGVDVWVPVVVDPAADEYGDGYFMDAVGRLAPAARPEDAAREMRAVARRMGELDPGWFTAQRMARATALPLSRQRTADRRTPVLIALGAALLVLLVACANAANLVVARTLSREREISLRRALGAGRLRTARLVLSEVGLLAVGGSALGWAVAFALIRVLEIRYPGALPAWGMAVDLRWIASAVGLVLLSALAAGLLPALRAARQDPARALAGGRSSSRSGRLARLQGPLSALQLAVATAGVAAIALLGRSLLELGRVDPGFDATRGVTFRVSVPPSDFPADAGVTAFFRRARTALQAVPGVEVAGFTSRLPLSGGDSQITVTPEGWTFQEAEPRPVAWQRLVTPGYLEAMGARLVAGRIPGPADDRAGLPELVVINRAAASAFWPGEPAIGKRFYGPDHTEWLTVAGVVDDILENGQTGTVLPGLYVPPRDWPWRTMYAVVRARRGQDPAALLPALEHAVWSVSAGAPVSHVETLEGVEARGLAQTRTLVLLAAVTGAVTLLLGALGIYSVVSHAVARRIPELGVRAALGAGRARLLRGELVGATRIVAAGTVAGLFLAWLIGHALGGSLYGVTPLDPASLAGATILLASVAYLAAWLPARRASRVDPVRVMRRE